MGKRTRRGLSARLARKVTPKPQRPKAKPFKSPADYHKSIRKIIDDVSIHHDSRRTFADAVEMMAISLSNAVNPLPKDEHDRREARYLELVKEYGDAVHAFPRVLAELTMALEVELHDALGAVYNDMELANRRAAQVFTPDSLSRLMAEMLLDSGASALIEKQGYITVQEPACGAGSMVIGLVRALHERGVNYQQAIHVTAIDIDRVCAHMTYVQLSLLNVPAVVEHGDTLKNETFDRWYTPAHVLGGWTLRLKAREAA